MVRRREREDYAPEDKETWEKREEQYERERKKKDKPKKKKKEPWEKREEQRERERKKKEKKPKEKKPRDRYEEVEDYEERATTKPTRALIPEGAGRVGVGEALTFAPAFGPGSGRAIVLSSTGPMTREQYELWQSERSRVLFETRLDTQQYPGEPSFAQRLHGRPKTPGIIDRWLIEEERAFGRVSTRLWEEGEKVRPKTKPLSFEEQAYRMGKREIPDIETAFARAQYGGIHLGAGFVEGVSFPVRPLAWGKTAKGIHGLITSKEKRREFGRAYRERPGAYGMQFLGGLAGGYVSGKGISGLSRKLGLTKPSTYRLKKVTVPRVSKTPATLMPKGKWRSTWEITRKGGTPALILKDKPDLMLIHKPVPVYRPSVLKPGFGIIGGIGAITKERTEAPERLEPGPQLPKGYLDVIQRMEPAKGRLRGEVEEATILKPVSWKKQDPLPWVEPGYRRKQRKRQRTTPVPILILTTRQEQAQRQRSIFAPIQIPLLRTEPKRKATLRLPFEEKKKKRRRRDLLFGFEQRKYAVQTAKDLRRLIG